MSYEERLREHTAVLRQLYRAQKRLVNNPSLCLEAQKFKAVIAKHISLGDRIVPDNAAPLNPTQKYMLRLVLFGAGKTIFHKGAICEVIEKHKHIRCLYPLINEDLSEAAARPFWVPRNAANRATASKERRGLRDACRILCKPPHYTGESRPTTHPDDGVALIPYVLESRTPSPESSGELCSTLLKVVFPREVMRAGIHLVRTRFNANRRTHRGFFSKESVMRGLSRMRTHSVMKTALMEVVYSRQSPTKIARIYCLPLGTLKVFATRLRNRIRTQNLPKNMQKAKQNGISNGEVLTICGVYEGR